MSHEDHREVLDPETRKYFYGEETESNEDKEIPDEPVVIPEDPEEAEKLRQKLKIEIAQILEAKEKVASAVNNSIPKEAMADQEIVSLAKQPLGEKQKALDYLEKSQHSNIKGKLLSFFGLLP